LTEPSGTPPRRGRRPGRPDTRSLVVAVATRQFARRGFVATTLRAVAREADVDPRLVSHYFPTKRSLFDECTRLPDRYRQDLHAVLSADPEHLGHRLTALLLTICDAPGQRDTVALLLAAFLVDEHGRTRMVDRLTSDVVTPLADTLAGPHPVARAQAAVACLLGLGVVRHVLAIPPLDLLPADQVVGLVGAVVQDVLEAPSPTAGGC
jgi:AcrR family transcriptional regulator